MSITPGLCQCGCGNPTKIAQKTNRSTGQVKGEPRRYVYNHHRRKEIRWEVEDRGYETPCMIWKGRCDVFGYGLLWFEGRERRVHRLFYEQRHGPLGDLHAHHKCEQPPCFNPDHIEPKDPAQHISDHKKGWRVTHCNYGHPFDAANTYTSPRGRRYCKACNQRYVIQRRAKLKMNSNA